MSVQPIITFKAGICELNTESNPPRVNPSPVPGYVYLFEEDELIQFCWRPRSAPMSSPELKLSMVPTDGRFVKYTKSDQGGAKTNGRIYVLKFQSSSARHLFWMQSRSQHPQGDPAWFSPRDTKIGMIVDRLLQGEELNVQDELSSLRPDEEDEGNGDAEMEDVSSGGSLNTSNENHHGGSSRDQGGDTSQSQGGQGGDANLSNETATAVQDFLSSLQGSNLASRQATSENPLFTTLSELLSTSTTMPFIDTADEKVLDDLLALIPSSLLVQTQEPEAAMAEEISPDAAKAAIKALSAQQKREILRDVLRSPQFTQSTDSLTHALRDGGLPSISDALKVPVSNNGFLKLGGNVPLGGGQAVEAFVQGFKKSIDEHDRSEGKMQED